MLWPLLEQDSVGRAPEPSPFGQADFTPLVAMEQTALLLECPGHQLINCSYNPVDSHPTWEVPHCFLARFPKS
jgi:hypothetical protein